MVDSRAYVHVRARWVVLKFGGTSVSTASRWRTIADLTAARRAEGLRPVVVCPALSGISNQLETLATLAVSGRHEAAESAIREPLLALAVDLRVDGTAVLADDLAELSRLALAASLLREAAPAVPRKNGSKRVSSRIERYREEPPW